ncbi:hypothetical protein [Vibrio albus]|jgi:hypothetical protein|uniref:hypothetical protein n=1 Tax=Vibrio albus TaxID=2200953 RepID=UPI0015E86A3B|nr:hypothetical protein [Vibrio albus]
MSEAIVSNLKQQLEVVGIDTLPLSDKEAKMFQETVETKARFFDTVCEQKQDSSPLLLLLGLLTKSHIEAIGRIEPQIETISAMSDVFEKTLGEDCAHKLEADSVVELSLVTKLWLMVQGYLNMDFSLANDHAKQTSDVLAKVLHAESDQIRSELLASYYHGKDKRKVDTPSWKWPKRLLDWLGTK